MYKYSTTAHRNITNSQESRLPPSRWNLNRSAAARTTGWSASTLPYYLFLQSTLLAVPTVHPTIYSYSPPYYLLLQSTLLSVPPDHPTIYSSRPDAPSCLLSVTQRADNLQTDHTIPGICNTWNKPGPRLLTLRCTGALSHRIRHLRNCGRPLLKAKASLGCSINGRIREVTNVRSGGRILAPWQCVLGVHSPL
jgi:hypothetical protein